MHMLLRAAPTITPTTVPVIEKSIILFVIKPLNDVLITPRIEELKNN